MSKSKTTKKSTKPSRGLGRGLSALMDDVGMDAIVDDAPAAETPKPAAASTESIDDNTRQATQAATQTNTSGKSITYVPMDQLTRNPDQPRRHFDSALLQELTDSIRDKGVLQPVLVRPLPDSVHGRFEDGKKPAYQIIAGERRWQAALKAGLDTIPVFVRDITDQEALEIGVVENVHRADLNPIEEALAYKSLHTQFGRTQEDVAKAVGKSRPYIANMLRLLNLPETVQKYLAEGKITAGHARAIVAAPNPEQIANIIVDNELSVRDAEKLVRRMKQDNTLPIVQNVVKAQKDADIRSLEEQLKNKLGLRVDLRHKGGKGELRIKYRNNDQLEHLIQRLLKSAG